MVGHVVGVGQVRPVVVAADQLVAPGREVDLGQAGEHGPLGGQELGRLRVDVGQPGLLVVVQHRVRPPAEHRADRRVPRTRSGVRTSPGGRRALRRRRRAPRPARSTSAPTSTTAAATSPLCPGPVMRHPFPVRPRGYPRRRAEWRCGPGSGDRRPAPAAGGRRRHQGGADAGLHEVGPAVPRRQQPRLPGDHARRAGRPRVARPGHLAGDRAGPLGRRRPSRGAVRRARRRQGPPVRRAPRPGRPAAVPAPAGHRRLVGPRRRRRRPTWSGRCCWRTPAGSARPWPPGRPTRTGGCAGRR